MRSNTRALAAAGKLVAEQEERATYWYVPEQLLMVVRAWAAASCGAWRNA
jgi:hypothetical protein